MCVNNLPRVALDSREAAETQNTLGFTLSASVTTPEGKGVTTFCIGSPPPLNHFQAPNWLGHVVMKSPSGFCNESFRDMPTFENKKNLNDYARV